MGENWDRRLQLQWPNYLITVDYYSGFWEADAPPNTTSRDVINKLKAHFARYGIPDVCISDNGPQFSSDEFKAFCNNWLFEHNTSSPGYPQSKGKAEQAVKETKTFSWRRRQRKLEQIHTFLSHRNTPTQGLDSSPVQRLMSRRTKTLLPTTADLLKPKLCANVSRAFLQKLSCDVFQGVTSPTRDDVNSSLNVKEEHITDHTTVFPATAWEQNPPEPDRRTEPNWVSLGTKLTQLHISVKKKKEPCHSGWQIRQQN